MSADLLKSLGHPSQKVRKHFVTCELEVLRAEHEWLNRVADALNIANRKRDPSWSSDPQISEERFDAEAVNPWKPRSGLANPGRIDEFPDGDLRSESSARR